MAATPKKKRIIQKSGKTKINRGCVKTEEYIQQLLYLNDIQRAVIGSLQKKLLG